MEGGKGMRNAGKQEPKLVVVQFEIGFGSGARLCEKSDII